jgi:hypothetical protein
MVNVILLPGSEVMAPLFYGFHWLKTQPRMIEVTGSFEFNDPDIHLDCGDSLSGIITRAIFNHDSLGLFVDPGHVAVYLGDMIESLEITNRLASSERLKALGVSALSLIIIPEGHYRTL